MQHVFAQENAPHIELKERRPVAGRRNRAQLSARALFRNAILITLTFVLFGGFVVYTRAQAAAFEYRKESIKEQIELQKIMAQEYEVQIAVLTDPGRIKSIAINKLGMIEPDNLTYISLSKKEAGEEKVLAQSRIVINEPKNPNKR